MREVWICSVSLGFDWLKVWRLDSGAGADGLPVCSSVGSRGRWDHTSQSLNLRAKWQKTQTQTSGRDWTLVLKSEPTLGCWWRDRSENLIVLKKPRASEHIAYQPFDNLSGSGSARQTHWELTAAFNAAVKLIPCQFGQRRPHCIWHLSWERSF